MLEIPKFIQGIYQFAGKGLDKSRPFVPGVTHKVSFDKRAQLVYARFGNSSPELLILTLKRDGELMRYFPVGAKSAVHVALAVTEDINPDTTLEIEFAAPLGVSGVVVVDLGLVEF